MFADLESELPKLVQVDLAVRVFVGGLERLVDGML